MKILHCYSNQTLFNCVVFISKLLSFRIPHMRQDTLYCITLGRIFHVVLEGDKLNTIWCLQPASDMACERFKRCIFQGKQRVYRLVFLFYLHFPPFLFSNWSLIVGRLEKEFINASIFLSCKSSIQLFASFLLYIFSAFWEQKIPGEY